MRTNYSAGIREYGRFKVHPDKILVRVFPIKGMTKVGEVRLWVPPSAQRRDAGGRHAKILQVGTRVEKMYPGVYKVGSIVICHNNVDNVYGREGKFRLGGKLVAVTMPSELLLGVEYENGDIIPDFIVNDAGVRETM